MTRFYRIGLLVAAVVWCRAAAAAQPTAPTTAPDVSPGLAQGHQLQDAFADIADRVSPSVVAIQSKRKLSSLSEFAQQHEDYVREYGDRLVPAIGSGVIIDPQGYVLTNEHVVLAAEELTIVLSDRRRYEGRVVATDPRSDLAVVRIVNGEAGATFRAAPLGDLSTVRQGHWAIALGNAFGLASEGRPGMTVGVISAIGRVLPSIGGPDRHYGNMIQTSADINPGSSGGPLLNLEGEVIGINTAISSRSGVSEGVGMAIPMTARTRQIIAMLKDGRTVEYGFLGVVVRSPGPADSARAGAPPYVGALVDAVEAGTPAAEADLHVGDVVVKVDGEVIEDSDHLVRLIGGSPIGRPIAMTLWRDRKTVNVKAVLRKRSEMIGVHNAGEPDVQPWRGMKLGRLTETRRRQLGIGRDVAGLEVLEVAEGSPAAVAGVTVGDVLDQLNGKPVKDLADLREIAGSLKAGAEVAVHLAKGGAKTLKAAP